MKGPAVFLVQFMSDAAPFNSTILQGAARLASIAQCWG